MNNNDLKIQAAPYATPVLCRLGSVRELTAAGSQPLVDETGNPGNCSQNTTRKFCR